MTLRTRGGLCCLCFFLLLGNAQPRSSITVEFWYDTESSQIFGGETALQSMVEGEISFHNQVLADSGMEGYQLQLVVRKDHPRGYGVRPAPAEIDTAPCDLQQRLTLLLKSKVVAAQRNSEQVSQVVLLTQCHGEWRAGVPALVPSSSRDLVNPAVGFIAMMTGGLGSGGLFSHEIGHSFGGLHPPGSPQDDLAASPHQMDQNFGKGIQFPPKAPGEKPETDVMGAGDVVHLPFYSNPRLVDASGRRMGVVGKQDMVRLLKARWAGRAALGQIRWNPSLN
jgi:hypothetical protein